VFAAYVYVWKKGGLEWSRAVTPIEEAADVDEQREEEPVGAR
jgi:hypothetical protein